MTLFQVLAMNERVIVWSSEEKQCIVTWNQSVTLQFWFLEFDSVTGLWDSGNWTEMSIQTLCSCKDFNAARLKAREWLNE